MTKRHVRNIDELAVLFRDDKTGIAWVEDGKTGNGYSAHPNIDVTGSIRGMRQRGWNKDRVVRSHGFYYNVDKLVCTDEYDFLAAVACRCVGCQDRAVNPLLLHAGQLVFWATSEIGSYPDPYSLSCTGYGQIIEQCTLNHVQVYRIGSLDGVRGGPKEFTLEQVWVPCSQVWPATSVSKRRAS